MACGGRAKRDTALTEIGDFQCRENFQAETMKVAFLASAAVLLRLFWPNAPAKAVPRFTLAPQSIVAFGRSLLANRAYL